MKGKESQMAVKAYLNILSSERGTWPQNIFKTTKGFPFAQSFSPHMAQFL